MAAFNTYSLGTRVRFSATFASSGGTPYDPTTLTVAVEAGEITQGASYPGGGIVRDGVGQYHFDYLVQATGQAIVTWASTQTGFESVSFQTYTFQGPPAP